MSMPKFPNPGEIPNLDDAISAIISSIAMEETALSHVINAEGEKIQYIIEYVKSQGYEDADTDLLLAVNNSVSEVLKNIAIVQELLIKKLDIITQYTPPTPPKPPKPPTPPTPPTPPRPPGPCFGINQSWLC